MAKQELRCLSINIWNGEPLTVGSPYAPGHEGMNMRIEKQGIGKGLNDRHHRWKHLVIFDRSSHELFYGIISGTTKLSEKLSMVEEIRPIILGMVKTHWA